MQVLFPGSPCWTRTNDPFGQKHSRLARSERFAMLVVSSCSEHRFICRRQRGAPSQLTAGAAVCGRVDGGCDANIKQCHSIPCSVEPWFFPYNTINKRFAWCEKSLNNNSVRQLLDGLLAVVLIILQSGVKETRWVAVLRNTGSIPVSANLNLKFYSGHRRRQAFLSCCTVLILLVVSRLFLYLDAQ